MLFYIKHSKLFSVNGATKRVAPSLPDQRFGGLDSALGSDIVDRGLKVLFFGLFAFFLLPIPPCWKGLIVQFFGHFTIFGLFSFGPHLLKKFSTDALGPWC